MNLLLTSLQYKQEANVKLVAMADGFELKSVTEMVCRDTNEENNRKEDVIGRET